MHHLCRQASDANTCRAGFPSSKSCTLSRSSSTEPFSSAITGSDSHPMSPCTGAALTVLLKSLRADAGMLQNSHVMLMSLAMAMGLFSHGIVLCFRSVKALNGTSNQIQTRPK